MREFRQAAASGDLSGLSRLLASDAVMHSDSGGEVRAARRLILGGERIARFFATLWPKKGPPGALAFARINGLPGLLLVDARGVTETLAFEIHGGRVVALYQVRDPDKLRRVPTRWAELPPG